MIDPIITVDELASLAASVAIADVRWYLGEPGLGRQEYERGHIPGAVHVDLDHDLSAAEGPGRHPLPPRSNLAARMGELGYSDTDPIVVYDDLGGAVAARLWWMLRDIGHPDVRVLDGGITAWRRTGHPIAKGLEHRHPSTMSVHPSLARTIDRPTLRGRLGEVTLLDARAVERYRGEEEPVDPLAGHIPTAISAPTTDNLTDDEHFLDPGELRERYSRLGVSADTETIVYCGSGVTACHNALAIVRAGLPEPLLYPGSWSDWSSNDEAVAVGAEPGSL